MSIVQKRVTSPVENVAADFVPMTPEQIVEQLRMLRQHIPLYGPLPKKEIRPMSRVAAVSREFVEAAIATIGASSSVQNALGATAEEMREDVREVGRWAAVEDELNAVLQGVRSGNLTRRHQLGLAALQTYSISQQLARSSDNAGLLPHIETMRRLSKFGRFRRKPVEPLAAPAPTA